MSNAGNKQIATDSNGNIYVVGDKGGAITTFFNANGTAYGTTVPDFRSYLAKYTAEGNVAWVASWGGSGFSRGSSGNGIALDSCGFVYAAGNIVATVFVSTGNFAYVAYDGSGNLAGVRNGGFSNTSGVLLKYSVDGSFQWFTLPVDATQNCTGAVSAVAVAPDNTVAVVGGFGGAGSFAVRNANGTTLSGGGSSTTSVQTVTVRYNPAGTAQWSALAINNPVGGNGALQQAIACDASSSIYVGTAGGSASNSTIVYNAGGTQFRNMGTTWQSTGNSADAYLIKYDLCGRGQWVTTIQSTQQDTISRIAIDTATQSLYVAGYSGGAGVTGSYGPIRFPWASNNGTYFPSILKDGQVGYLARYARLTDTVPGPISAFRFDSCSFFTNDRVNDIAPDRRGNIYVACQVADSSGTRGILSDAVVRNYLQFINPTINVNLVSYDSNGMLRWYQSIRSPSGYLRIFAVATDYDANVIVTGECGATTTNFYAMA
jgi:hypothetical protein